MIPTAPLRASTAPVRCGSARCTDEGSRVPLCGADRVSDHLLPPKAAIEAAEGDQVALEHTLWQERTLLFVACTRARDALYVSYVGRPSRLIADSH